MAGEKMKISSSILASFFILATVTCSGSGHYVVKRTGELIGDLCDPHNACLSNSECTSKTSIGYCTCKIGFHVDNSLRCVAGNPRIGSICFKELGCEHLRISKCNSKTGRGTCVCFEGYYGDIGSSTCELVIGGDCPTNKTCTSLVPNSICNEESKCACEQGFYQSYIYCSPVITTPCPADKNCSSLLPHTTCSNYSKCECEDGYKAKSYICAPEPGTSCTVNEECSDDFAVCTGGVCTCIANYTLSGGVCMADSKLGDYCDTNKTCTGGAECNSKIGPGLCTCMGGFHADDTLACVIGNATVGSLCNNNVGCEYVTNSKCITDAGEGVCICADGFHGDAGSLFCVPDVGSPCKPSVGCYDPAMACKESLTGEYTCQCQKGFEVVGNACKKGNVIHIHVHEVETKDTDIYIES